MPMNTTSAPEPLHPNQPILDSEIQQIAPEELNHNIQTAESTIKALIELKLPRSLKRKIGECSNDIQNSKKSDVFQHPIQIKKNLTHFPSSAFEQTGEIPEDEGIQVNQPQLKGPSSPTNTLATTSRKPANLHHVLGVSFCVFSSRDHKHKTLPGASPPDRYTCICFYFQMSEAMSNAAVSYINGTTPNHEVAGQQKQICDSQRNL